MSYYGRSYEGLNPRDFGAKGNGVDDDTLAFQACIAEAVSSGINSVFFDNGIYPMGDQAVTPPKPGGVYLLNDLGVDGFVFEGTGPNSVLLIHPNQAGTTSFSVVGLIPVSNPVSKRVIIRNFRIDGNKALTAPGVGSFSVSGVSIGESEDVFVENVIVHDIPSNAEIRGYGFSIGASVDTEFAYRVRVSNCVAYDNGGAGFRFMNTQEFCSLENSIGFNNRRADIFLNNLSNSSAARSVFVRNCTAVVGPANVGGASPFTGLFVDAGVSTPGEDIQVDGCTILGRIQIKESNRAFFDDCIVYGTEGGQILVEQKSDLTSFSNSILSTAANGPVVSLTGGLTFTTKKRCSFRNNVFASVIQSVTGDRKAGEDIEFDGNTFIALGSSNAPHISLDSVTRLSGIVGVNQGSSYFEIAGDFRDNFAKGSGALPDFEISVNSSTGNNGTYTVASTSFTGGNTRIVVNEPIPSPLVDGNITFNVMTSARIRRNVFAGDIQDVAIAARDVNSWRAIIITENYFGCTKTDIPVLFGQNVGANYASCPVLINNLLGSNKTRLVASQYFQQFLNDAYVVGGNYETQSQTNPTGIARQLVTDSSPASRIFGWIGEECTNVNGGAGTVHYVKDSGNLTFGGWVGK